MSAQKHRVVSPATLAKSANYKASCLKYYSDLFNWLHARKERRLALEKSLEGRNFSTLKKNQKRQNLALLETRYMRQRRNQIKVNSFEVIRVIGRGGFGEVRLVQLLGTEKVFAMKVLKKSRLIKRKQEIHVKSERNALAHVSDYDLSSVNRWVTKLYYSFQDQDYLYLVMEYVPGGDLLHKLIELDVFTLEQTRFYIAELVLAIDSIHNLNWVHRDVKPDNILLDENGHVKLTDFGLCTGLVRDNRWSALEHTDYESHPDYQPDEEAPFHHASKRVNSWNKKRKFIMRSAVGTPDYIAPEVLTSKDGYTKACDWWSVGVIMFEMLAGGPPFSSDSPYKTRENVVNYKWVLQQGWQRVELFKFPPIARDLVLRFLSDASIRIGSNGVEEIKAHPFFAGIDWDNLRDTIAPIIPTVTSTTDTRNFPSEEIMEEPGNGSEDNLNNHLAQLDQAYDKLMENTFSGFTYTGFFAIREECCLSL